MTPEEIEAKKAEILKSLHENILLLTRKNLEIYSIKYDLDFEEKQRDMIIHTIKARLQEYCHFFKFPIVAPGMTIDDSFIQLILNELYKNM